MERCVWPATRFGLWVESSARAAQVRALTTAAQAANASATPVLTAHASLSLSRARSLLRPGRRHGSVAGLHWVGASTRPGNGVPLVLIGAMQTADEVLADLEASAASST